MGKVKTESTDLRETVYELAEDLNRLVSREHQTLQDELGQASILVSDAIQGLVKSFNSLNVQVAEQASIVQHIATENSGSQTSDSTGQKSGQLERLSELSNLIKQDVAAVTRSLQFDDILQQLVLHSHNRAVQMDRLFAVLSEKLSELKVVEPDDYTQISNYIDAMQAEINRFRVALEKANPVKQTSMGSGKVELF